VKRLPRVQKRDAVTTGKAVRNTNVKSVICFLGVQNRTKIEPRKRLIIEIREIFVRGLRAAFPPRVCRSLNRESVPYINSFSGAAFPPSAAAPQLPAQAAHAIPHPAFSHISPANACRRLRNRCLHPIVPRAQDVNVVSAAGLSPRAMFSSMHALSCPMLRILRRRRRRWRRARGGWVLLARCR
jgi:hypothetical protein